MNRKDKFDTEFGIEDGADNSEYIYGDWERRVIYDLQRAGSNHSRLSIILCLSYFLFVTCNTFKYIIK